MTGLIGGVREGQNMSQNGPRLYMYIQNICKCFGFKALERPLNVSRRNGNGLKSIGVTISGVLDMPKCRIFRPKLLHPQFHLFSTALVIKTQRKSDNGEIYTAGKNFTLPLAPSSDKSHFWFK